MDEMRGMLLYPWRLLVSLTPGSSGSLPSPAPDLTLTWKPLLPFLFLLLCLCSRGHRRWPLHAPLPGSLPRAPGAGPGAGLSFLGASRPFSIHSVLCSYCGLLEAGLCPVPGIPQRSAQVQASIQFLQKCFSISLGPRIAPIHNLPPPKKNSQSPEQSWGVF